MAKRGHNIRKPDKWPHPDGWLCQCPECMGRRQRQRDELTARYRAERIWVDGHWEAPVPPEKHGLLSTATHRGCECARCTGRLTEHGRTKRRNWTRPKCKVPGCSSQGRHGGLCRRHVLDGWR